LATRKIKQIADTNKSNTIHKIHQYDLKQIKTILEQNDLRIAKADKGRTMVIINKEALKQKTDNFIQDNQIIQLNKDPTDSFKKQIQQTIHKLNALIDKNQHIYILQMKPMAPQLNSLIKIHKEDKPIRPVTSNIWSTSYKLAKHLNKNLNQLIHYHTDIKGKAIPLQALTGPEGSRRLRLPDFKTIGT
jgi:hypothetical protein